MEKRDIVQLYSATLKGNFGFDLKEKQISAISYILKKQHAFIALPTGFGKSLCYILPPLLLDEQTWGEKPHIAIVISPLISLMQDQVKSLQLKGIKTVMISKEMSNEEKKGVENGVFNIIFSSPEAILNDEWLNLIRSSKVKDQVCLVAFDEAHCMIEWESFRDAYRNVGRIGPLFKNASIALLTGTVTPSMFDKILEAVHLNKKNVHVVAAVPDRPNIYLDYRQNPGIAVEALKQVQQQLQQHGKEAPKTLIYGRTVATITDLCSDLCDRLGPALWAENGEHFVCNRLVGLYTKTSGDEYKKFIVREFPAAETTVRCVFCTVAFGLGVDIPDVKFVYHWMPSETVLSYWQEVGRAGRNGAPANAILLLAPLSARLTVDDQMKEALTAIKDGACMRQSILKNFLLPEMGNNPLGYLSRRKKCNSKCESCKCVYCLCCINCKSKCPCFTD